MMSIKVPVGDSWSAMITAELSGFSVRASSTIWRIWFSSTSRLLIQMSPVWSTPIRMLPRGRASAVSASGRLGSMPVSFTKEVVTMKKISMMNTMSSIGVMLISASSSCRFSRLRIACSAAASVVDQHLLEALDFLAGPPFEIGGQIETGQRRHQTGHGRDGGRRDAAGHQARVAGAGECHHVEDEDHAGHGAQQAEQRQDRHQRLDHQDIAVTLHRDLRDELVADAPRKPGVRVLALVPLLDRPSLQPGQDPAEEPEPLDDQRPH